jgi:hypothetical protein
MGRVAAVIEFTVDARKVFRRPDVLPEVTMP